MKISEQKDPSGESIKFILDLFNSNKINEAKNEIDKQLIKNITPPKTKGLLDYFNYPQI